MPRISEPSATASGVPPLREMRSEISESDGGTLPPASFTNRAMASVAPLRSRRPSISTPLMRVYAENGMKFASCSATSRPRRLYFCLASTTIERPSGVSSARLESCAASASSLSLTPSTGMNSTACRLPRVMVPVLSRSKRVDVAGGLHGFAAHGQHVVLHHAVHAGDADGGKQSADGGRDQADQQRNQDRDGRRAAAADSLNGIFGIRRQRDNGQQENQRQAGDQDVERDFVGRLLPHGAFHQRDHAVQERFAGIGGDADLDVVGEDLRAAGDGAAIAAGFANDRRALSGDHRFVDAGDAFDHFAVSGNQVARLAVDDVAGAQLRGRHHLELVVGQKLPRHGVGLGLAQGIGLSFAAGFRHGFGEIGEQHREPQPQRDLDAKQGAAGAAERILDDEYGRQSRSHFDHEHHRILCHQSRDSA